MAYIPPHISLDGLMYAWMELKKECPMSITRNATKRWCTIGLDDENQYPTSVNLEPISSESTEWISKEKPLALMNTLLDDGVREVRWNLPKSPWVSIAENVLEELLKSFENVRKQMELEQLQPHLVARVGKVLFHRCPSDHLEEIVKSGVSSDMLKQFWRSFYTDVPPSYVDKILKEVVPKMRFYIKEKQIYTVKLSDKTKPKQVLSLASAV